MMLIFDPVSVNQLLLEDEVKKLTTLSNFCSGLIFCVKRAICMQKMQKIDNFSSKTMQKIDIMSKIVVLIQLYQIEDPFLIF